MYGARDLVSLSSIIQYTSLPGCTQTLEMFFDIVKTCQKATNLSAASVNCPSFDRATQTVGDPVAFCKGD